MWDGEPEDDTSDDSDSSADEANPSCKEKHDKKDTKTKKNALKGRSRINDAVSSKLGGLLNRKSPSQDDAPDSGEPSTKDTKDASGQDTAVKVPSRPEPMVLHGHTLTKGATFRDVCNAIRDSAFVATDLPVIVSLEVHACLEQQEIMVEIMQEAWKGLLVDITPELLSNPHMPTLEQLKRKILIKVKWLPQTGDVKAGEAAEDTEELEATAEKQKSQDGSTAAPPPKPSKILQALSQLAVYTKGFSFRHLEQPGMHSQCATT